MPTPREHILRIRAVHRVEQCVAADAAQCPFAHLHEEDLAIAQRTPGLRAEDQPTLDKGLSDEDQEVRRLAQRRLLREQ